MIIGIAGTLGAGKGTVVEYLKEKNFTHYSVSGRLKEILDERNLLGTRENLSSLADELAVSYEGGILEVMHQKAKEDGVTDYILESIHRESEAEYLRSIGAIILGVNADPEIRYERTFKRQEGDKDNVTYEEFLNSIAREEEGKGEGTPNILAVLQSADFVLQNNGSVEELHEQIEEVLSKINEENI